MKTVYYNIIYRLIICAYIMYAKSNGWQIIVRANEGFFSLVSVRCVINYNNCYLIYMNLYMTCYIYVWSMFWNVDLLLSDEVQTLTMEQFYAEIAYKCCAENPCKYLYHNRVKFRKKGMYRHCFLLPKYNKLWWLVSIIQLF